MKSEEYRSRLLNWWRSLTDEQKKVLPTTNNTIDLRELFNDEPKRYHIIRRNLKGDIKKIEAELKVLDVLFDVDAYRKRLFNWWKSLSDDQKKSVLVVNQTIELRDLFDGAPISYKTIRQYLQEDIKKIDAELKVLDVLFDVDVYKKRLLNWWKGLTSEQKKELPTLKNSINLRNLFDGSPIRYIAIRQYLKKEIKEIDAELKALGAFSGIEKYREHLLNWWQPLTDEQKKKLPISNNTIDLRELFNDASISHSTIRKKLKEDIKKIDAELKSLNILFDRDAYIKRLNNWWQSLTNEQKKKVPTINGSIDLRELFSASPTSYKLMRRYLKYDIDKIDAELKVLGVFFDVETYRKRLLNWWESFTDTQKKAVSITNNTIDLSELFNDAPINYYTIRKYLKNEIKKIDTELKSLNILFDCEEYRKLLNNWWRSLTDDQKKMVTTFRNTIDLHFLFNEAPISYVRVREFLKEDINRIDTELKLLRGGFNDNDEAITALMSDFICECNANPKLLWDIELTSHMVLHSKVVSRNPDRYFEEFGFISKAYLMNKFSCSSKSLDKPALLDLRKQLNRLLLDHEVSLPYHQVKASSDSIGHDLNNRRIFLKWKNSLTDENKLALPILGNKIKQSAFSHVISTKCGAIKRPILKAEYRRFSNEIAELRGIKFSYKTVKERAEIRKNKSLNKEESQHLVFIKLRNKNLVSIDDFKSKKGYYEDVKHVFAAGSLKATSKSGIMNYYNGYRHYCGFLESKRVLPKSSYRECFNSWSLRDFKEYLGHNIAEATLTTSSATTILSTLRMSLNKLKRIHRFEFNYYPADGFEVVRESITYKAYSPNERKQIHKMLEQEMVLAKKKLTPYQKLDRKTADLDDPKIQARIIFEDYCNCIPIYNVHRETRTKGQNKLIYFISSRRFSLVELYEEWGVLTRQITSRDIGVYILKMAQILGMNLNPILDLELDDYQEHHPLTNKPCLTYWKERSTGEKMLHLDLFHADLQWLTVSQKHFVEKVFDEVAQLTSETRKYAPDELSNRLFITFFKKITTITETTMSRLYAELIDKYQLKDDDGQPLALTITRFRPTLVSELIEVGVSIREIQYMLGHSSIFTTIGYIDKLEFDRVIKDKARKAIKDIYKNTVHASEQYSSKKESGIFDANQVIMKTPLGGCKNIFDPPEFIKKSSLYVKGKPCSQYNKCLSCENVMLTEKHLPELFAMQRDYLATLESSEVVSTPYHVVVLENLSLLGIILSPETSEFEEDVLMQAKEDSLFVESTILDNWGR